VGKEDLCVVLTASLGMGVGRRSGGDLGGTHARHASPLRATRLRVCGEVVRRGVVLWLGSRAPAREGENEGECMEELSRRDESETCRHISGVRTVCGRAQDG